MSRFALLRGLIRFRRHRRFVDAKRREFGSQILILEVEAGIDRGEEDLVDLLGKDGETLQRLELAHDRAALQHRGKGLDNLVDAVGIEGSERHKASPQAARFGARSQAVTTNWLPSKSRSAAQRPFSQPAGMKRKPRRVR